jgi:asparagine synthase (glutamine-hydrolysing)
MGCGIAGFVGLDDHGLLRRMCESIRYRGPDDMNFFEDGKVGLGIDRLSIIDVEGGRQPIHNEDGTVWVVFNGEIYNYLELKVELQELGHRFYTNADTETLVHGYEEWGTTCLSHLRGMFAFALWDSKDRRLFMARDRFGKKPLYYSLLGDIFLFGSEIKAILQYDQFERKIDYEALDHYFTYMYIPSPLTIFQGIRKLPPGSLAIYRDGHLSISTYWDLRLVPDDKIDEASAVKRLEAMLEDAVRLRLRSDVSLGAFLSGGIDSSVVVALMSRLSKEPIKTVSIGFDTPQSELKFSRAVADYLHTDHTEHIVTPDSFEILGKIVSHFDEPFADHSMIPTYYLSQVTARQVTVAMSGDGGDELFMGYPFLTDPTSYGLYSKIPGPLRRIALRAVLALPVDTQMRRMADHANEKDYGASQSYAQRFVSRVTLYDLQGLNQLYSKEHRSNHPSIDASNYVLDLVQSAGTDELDSLAYATIRSYLEEDILVKVDRMSMANSLEVRCPLLDQEVAGYVGTLPSHMKLRDGTTKYILKKLAVERRLIPKEIAVRKKQGFGAPIEAWLKGEWKDLVSQLVDPESSSACRTFFDREAIAKLLREPYLNSNKIFAISTFLLWHDQYVERDDAPLIKSTQ